MPRLPRRTVRKPPAKARTAQADLRGILDSWAEHGQWESTEHFCELGERASELGHAPLAYEILCHGLAIHPQHPRLLYLTALASAKTGSYSASADYVDRLLPRLGVRSKLYVEAKSLEGRIAKDRWARLPSGVEKDMAGASAVAAYESAYRASHSYFPGINAATMNVLLGHRERGTELAQEVRALCLKRLRAGCSEDHWRLATLGEACLLLGQQQEALLWYGRAARVARKRLGDIATMRRQLRLIEKALPVTPDLYGALAVPKVAVFSGHMLDRPDRQDARFPPQLEQAVAQAVGARIKADGIGIGYCSAACGADILFIEQMRKRGAEVHVTLPFNREDFLTTSVAFAGQDWVQRFDRALRMATSVGYAVQERYLGDDVLFEYTVSFTQGSALLRAGQLETEAVMLAVADEADDARVGGTHSAITAWQKHGLPLRRIGLRELREVKRRGGAAAAKRHDTSVTAASPARRTIKTMLFADMVGFSKLQEEDTPAFLVNFLGEIARVVQGSGVSPDFVNTWGDGLFMVFANPALAADFALRLRDAVRGTRWTERGLPAETNIRIGMHSGPVFPARDPIIQRDNFFGSHVNRAARIEPVTAPGAVYVSEQTAALLAASRNDQFACDYLGSMPLAKHFGDSVLYRLRRTHESE